MTKILVLDTNVLLTDPHSLYRFPNATVIIPQTVLQELDKIKMTRADKTLQYNGRLISRYLFSLSSAGNLSEGVELENGSIVKVANLEDKTNLPPNLKTKFSDDQILALAYQVQQENAENDVTLITNDLNMLIKAQSLGLKIEHHGGLDTTSKARRFFTNQIATIKKNPVIALFFVLTLGGIVAIIVLLATTLGAPTIKGPPELVAQMQILEAKEAQYKNLLDKNSADQKALFGLAELYVQTGIYLQDSQYYNKAIDLLEQAPKNSGRNFRIEAMISRLHFYLGMNDIAYAELNKIVKSKADSALKSLLEQSRKAFDYKDYSTAIKFLNKAIIMRPSDTGIRLDLAQAYYNNNQANETINVLHKALAIDKKNAIIYYNLGYVYWQKRADATTAIGYFQKYLELEPQGDLTKQAHDNIVKIKEQLNG